MVYQYKSNLCVLIGTSQLKHDDQCTYIFSSSLCRPKDNLKILGHEKHPSIDMKDPRAFRHKGIKMDPL